MLAKPASRCIGSLTLLLLASAGSLLVFPVVAAAFWRHFQFLPRNWDCWFDILGGVVGAVGGLFFYLAISKGEVSRVVAITATYPVITVVLAALFLREGMSLHKVAGIVLAVLGVCLLSH